MEFNWKTLENRINQPARLLIKGRRISLTPLAVKLIPRPATIEVDAAARALRFRTPLPGESPYSLNSRGQLTCKTDLPDGVYLPLDDGVFVLQKHEIIPHKVAMKKGSAALTPLSVQDKLKLSKLRGD